MDNNKSIHVYFFVTAISFTLTIIFATIIGTYKLFDRRIADTKNISLFL